MVFRAAGALRVHVLSDATLPDPGRHPRVVRIATEVWQAGTGVVTRSNEVDRFVLLLAGRGSSEVGADPQYAAGQLILTPAGSRLRLAAAADEDLSLIIVTAQTPGFRRRLAARYDSLGNAKTVALPLRSFGEAETLLRRCLEHAERGDSYQQRTALAYFATFLALLTVELSSPPSSNEGREETFRRARELIDARALEIDSADQAAALLQLSPDYLNRGRIRRSTFTFSNGMMSSSDVDENGMIEAETPVNPRRSGIREGHRKEHWRMRTKHRERN